MTYGIDEARGIGKTGSAGLNSMSKALSAMGLSNSKSMQALQMSIAAMQVMNGAVKVIGMVHARTVAMTKADGAKAAALTAANMAMGPPGWAKIAIATASMAIAGAGIGYALSRINAGRYDLSNPLERQEAVQSVKEVML
jgi:hypothetical protein